MFVNPFILFCLYQYLCNELYVCTYLNAIIDIPTYEIKEQKYNFNNLQDKFFFSGLLYKNNLHIVINITQQSIRSIVRRGTPKFFYKITPSKTQNA